MCDTYTSIDNSKVTVSPSRQLKGSLGVTSIVLMVIAAAGPLGVVAVNTPTLIAIGNGGAAPFDALVATAIMLLFVVGFVAMSKCVDNAGAFYTYIQKGLGRKVGLGSATLALVSYFLILLAIEAYLGCALRDMVRYWTGIEIAWWVYTLCVVAIIGLLGYRHIELSSRFLGVALLLEILLVVVVDAAVIIGNGGTLDTTAFSPQVITSGSPGLGILFAVYCFVGLESTVIFKEEARDPDKTIPRATYASVLIIGAIYALSMWCLVDGYGVAQVKQAAIVNPAHLYHELTSKVVGVVARDLVEVLLVTSLFACALSFHNVIVRYQYVMGRFGVLSGHLASVHKYHGAPHVSSFVQTATSAVTLLVFLLLGVDPVTQIYAWGATAGTLGYMVLLCLTCISVVLFFRNKAIGGSRWHTCIAPVGALIGLAICLWIALENLPDLIGGEGAYALAIAMVVVVMAGFAFGYLVAASFKRWAPLRFEGLKGLA
ncbi:MULTISPECIES: APC family permease [unclassified Pseudomonas]|uniref:APC family permease n=1 Tax=unclassified Pseudomonas TaxID=196821 RepID=UPI0025801BB2|nr:MULTISPECIES: APC family permease [unclassified Pseudomonas]